MDQHTHTQKRTISRITAALLASALLCSCVFLAGFKKTETLTLYTWADMFPQEVLKGFTKETGIKINYVNFDYDETMFAKLQAAEGGDYDLVIADDYIIEQAVAAGLVTELDKTKLSNYGNIDPTFTGQFYDPQDLYTVPYGAGIIEIAYYPERVGFEITGYEDLWNEALKDRVGIIGNIRVVDGIVLQTLGYSMNTVSESEIGEAGEKLQKLAPNIRLIKDDYLNDDLVAGEIDAALVYTSMGTMAALTDPDVRLVLPEEGLGYGVQAMFIPSKAPHAEAAYQFIDYILRPEISAECFAYLGYYCTVKAAEDLIPEEIRPFITLPEDLSVDRMEMIENIPGEIYDLHENIWNRFKSLCS